MTTDMFYLLFLLEFSHTPKSVLFLIRCSPWKTRLGTYKTIPAPILQEEKSIEQSSRGS